MPEEPVPPQSPIIRRIDAAGNLSKQTLGRIVKTVIVVFVIITFVWYRHSQPKEKRVVAAAPPPAQPHMRPADFSTPRPYTGNPQPSRQAPSVAQHSDEDDLRKQAREQRRAWDMRAATATSIIADGTKAQLRNVSNVIQQERQHSVEPAVHTEAPAQHKDLLAYDPSLPLYTLAEHTVINAVLDSKIEGEMSGPIDAHVSMNVYLPNSTTLIIPQGAKITGEENKVSYQSQSRLAVTFHRILVYVPGSTKPYSISLDKATPGLDQQGGAGLHGKTNNHFLQIFGASIAVGLVNGLSELGSYGGGYSPAYGFYNGISQSTSESTYLVMSRYLNRLPTNTVQEGTRVVIELLEDTQLPSYEEAANALLQN